MIWAEFIVFDTNNGHTKFIIFDTKFTVLHANLTFCQTIHSSSSGQVNVVFHRPTIGDWLTLSPTDSGDRAVMCRQPEGWLEAFCGQWPSSANCSGAAWYCRWNETACSCAGREVHSADCAAWPEHRLGTLKDYAHMVVPNSQFWGQGANGQGTAAEIAWTVGRLLGRQWGAPPFHHTQTERYWEGVSICQPFPAHTSPAPRCLASIATSFLRRR